MRPRAEEQGAALQCLGVVKCQGYSGGGGGDGGDVTPSSPSAPLPRSAVVVHHVHNYSG